MIFDYKNPQLPPELRAELLLKELTLDEKMAQVCSLVPFGPSIWILMECVSEFPTESAKWARWNFAAVKRWRKLLRGREKCRKW